MKNIFNKKLYAIVLGFLFFAPACTDLQEELYSDVTDDNFFQTDEEFIAALGQAYSSLFSMGNHFNTWSINELTTDELVVPTKGGDWYDGGVLLQLHEHKFTPDNAMFNSAWGQIYGGVNTCNRLIAQFGVLGTPAAEAFIGELRAVRALWYFYALDAFGNVPLVVDFSDAVIGNESSLDAGRTKVYNFLISELNEIIPSLDASVGGSAYGRMNQAAAIALRQRLYLNSEVYTGTAEWQKVIDDANAIEGFGFQLAGDYSSNFAVENSGSPENIFVVPYDKVFAGGFNWNMMTLHISGQNIFNLTSQPWNGYGTVEEFYNSYIDPDQNPGPQGPVWSGLAGADDPNHVDGVPNDVGTQDSRLSNFLVGDIYNQDGSRLEDPGHEPDDPNGPPVTHTPASNEIWPNGWRQGLARIQKYEFEVGGTNNMSNDFVIFRWGGVLLSKAEAMYRLGDAAGALAIVNDIRARAGVDPFTDLDDTNLLAEIGREMYAELTRRQDLIRFGRFGDAWWEKDVSTEQYEVFPIPQPQIDVNAALNQNPGY
ncbi:MAG: RagB/SusD family nutrient uptake outer membrane protein [Cyclobacteriaceae bacterium]